MNNVIKRTHINSYPAIAEHLAVMNQKDTWSLMLFALYRLHDDPNGLTLSELAYLLKTDDLVLLLSYFEGMTITFPKLKDLRLLTQAFNVYRLVNFENIDMDAAIKSLNSPEFSKDELKSAYLDIAKVVADYDFQV